MALTQFISIRLLTAGLGHEQYAAFAILTGILGWYTLADLGVGTSLQNTISQCRAHKRPYANYLHAVGLIAIALFAISISVLYLLSLYLGPLLLRNFAFDSDEKVRQLFVSGAFLAAAAIGGIAYKIWYAENRGHLGNIVQAVAAILGLLGLWVVLHLSHRNRLLWSLVAYTGPGAVLAILSLIAATRVRVCEQKPLRQEDLVRLFKHGLRFWFFILMAMSVVQIDYVVMSQYLQPSEIVAYAVVTKMFTLVFFMYNSVLSALWPVFSELIALGNWSKAQGYLTHYLSLGIALMLFSTVALVFAMPKVIHLLSPTQAVVIPMTFILLSGFYHVIRIWTDTFAMVLQSMNDMTPFVFFVPIQALLSAAGQVFFVKRYGIYGILIGLICSFCLTVTWMGPLRLYRHFRGGKLTLGQHDMLPEN